MNTLKQLKDIARKSGSILKATGDYDSATSKRLYALYIGNVKVSPSLTVLELNNSNYIWLTVDV